MKRILPTIFSALITAVFLFVIYGCSVEEESPKKRAQSGPDYLAIVRNYADAMIGHGRDTYGTESSPLFATTLNRKTLKLFGEEELEKIKGITRDAWGIRPNDRMITGANPMHDQNLYRLLYALTAVTGDKRYASEADSALRWFFERCQSENTGLMTWGEHMGWDFNTETIIEKTQGTTHEFFRPWLLWDRSFDLAPEACEKFAHGLREHQIYDVKAGNFSRHAAWDRHGPGKDNEYPRHGGFYIATWASAYERTKDTIYLDAIETLIDYYTSRRNGKTGAIPCCSTPERIKIVWPESNLSLAIELWDAAEKVPDKLAGKMR